VRGVNDTLGVYVQMNETTCIYYNETSALNETVPIGTENSTCTNSSIPTWFLSNCTTCISPAYSIWEAAPCVNVTSQMNITACVQPCTTNFTNKPCLWNNSLTGTLMSSSRRLQSVNPSASSILPALPSLSSTVKTVTQNFVTSDLGIVIAERFNLKYILPLGIFALVWTILLVLGFLTVWFFHPIVKFLYALVAIPVRIVLYCEMSCWNPKTGCLWRIATCCGCEKSLKKRSKKDTERSKETTSNDDLAKDEGEEEVERVTTPEEDIKALSDIGGGDLEGFLPPVTWASVVAAKHIQTGRVPPIADVIQALLNSQGGISGGFNSDDELGKELAKEAAKMDAEERSKRNASCGLCILRTFCCFCLCAHHAFCGKRPPKSATKKETLSTPSKGKKKEEEKKKKNNSTTLSWLWGSKPTTNSSKSSKSKKDKENETGKSKSNEETGIELTNVSSWSISLWGNKSGVSKGASDKKNKDDAKSQVNKTSSSKTEKIIDKEKEKAELIRNELKRGFFCCGGNIRCGRLRNVRPGTESEDGRRVLIGIPDFNTAFSLRMLSGVPTYNILSSPRVLSTVFSDYSQPGQLSKRYNTLAEATLFTDLDLIGEDQLASQVGGWESTKDVGTGTSLDGSTWTAHTTIEGEDSDNEDEKIGKSKNDIGKSKKKKEENESDSDDGIEMTNVKSSKKNK
jgi:hypothetical protein